MTKLLPQIVKLIGETMNKLMTKKRVKLKYSFYQVGCHFKLKQFPTTNEKHLHNATRKKSNISHIIIIIT